MPDGCSATFRRPSRTSASPIARAASRGDHPVRRSSCRRLPPTPRLIRPTGLARASWRSRLVRLFASYHRNQWTFVDFGGLKTSHSSSPQGRMISGIGGGGGIGTLDPPNRRIMVLEPAPELLICRGFTL